MIKRENYVSVQGWMITDLHLTGNKLMAYALIYGFSQTKGSVFSGSYKYIAEWLGCSERNAIRIVNELCEDGIVEKTQTTDNGVTYNMYRAIVPSEPVEEPKKERKERKPRESLKDKEPANDSERVGKRYYQNCESLFSSGKLQTSSPCVNWIKAMPLIKKRVDEYGLDTVIAMLDRATGDDWIVGNGYLLSTILSANVFNRLLQAKPQGVGVGHGKDEYTGGADF